MKVPTQAGHVGALEKEVARRSPVHVFIKNKTMNQSLHALFFLINTLNVSLICWLISNGLF